MTPPRFRGDSDDWMDDEGVSSGSRSGMRNKKANVSKATYLESKDANATVAEVFPKQCRINLDCPDSGFPAASLSFLCSYRRAQVVGQAGLESRERTPVAVGDRVLVSRSSPDSGVVEGVCERRNRLMRRAPGRQGEDAGKVQHVLAANVDLVVIVASLCAPEFSPGLVDRFLVGAQLAGIEVMICVTKIDLWQDGGSIPWEIYRQLGWKVTELSVRTGVGVEDFRHCISGKTVVFCGRSGAGKTSLLNLLLGSEVGRVGQISDSTGKGRHTTSSAILLDGPKESQWIDTPGVREFALAEIEPARLAGFFPEFHGLICEGVGCLHSGEAGCAAGWLVRHSSYLRIFESLKKGDG
ncbi:ribosome small subunit-dependent GTPase A [Bdellovibrionota bacterium FG-1]